MEERVSFRPSSLTRPNHGQCWAQPKRPGGRLRYVGRLPGKERRIRSDEVIAHQRFGRRQLRNYATGRTGGHLTPHRYSRAVAGTLTEIKRFAAREEKLTAHAHKFSGVQLSPTKVREWSEADWIVRCPLPHPGPTHEPPFSKAVQIFVPPGTKIRNRRFMAAMRVRTSEVETLHEPERRSPTRRGSIDRARAGSETGAPARFRGARRATGSGSSLPLGEGGAAVSLH